MCSAEELFLLEYSNTFERIFVFEPVGRFASLSAKQYLHIIFFYFSARKRTSKYSSQSNRRTYARCLATDPTKPTAPPTV
jgi:hypothetical protein